MARNVELGAFGEELAVGHLLGRGMVVLDRNWRCRYGELDVIAEDDGAVVFVEVKTRTGRGFGTPAEAVTHAKRARIRRLAGLWLREQPRGWRRVRFDVVSVLVPPRSAPELTHLEAVF
ncbi:YraN family protein [Rhodococcus sp. NPDC058532]|uniref:YraN family protein n=1 Tax=Rhodococcus sp. NPDC058532 TaxID=3346540 RepID=UPI003647DFDF